MHFPNQRLHWDLQFIGMPKIGNWNIFTLFWILSILCFLTMKVKTNLVGNRQGIRILKCVSTISPFPLLLTLFSFENLCGVQRSLLGLLSSHGLLH